jgi:hypothetical protein
MTAASKCFALRAPRVVSPENCRGLQAPGTPRLPDPRRWRRNLTAPVAAALLWLVPPAPAADPVTLLPENTIIGLTVAKPEKLAALADHPVIKAVKPGRLKELFGKALDALEEGPQRKIWQDECGLSPGEVLAKFSGAMAFGIFDAKAKKPKNPEDGQSMETGLAVAFDGDEKLVAGILRAIAKIEAGEDGTGEDASEFGQLLQAKERTVDAGGVTLHILDPESLKEENFEALAWCVRDKMLLAASGEKPLRAMIERAGAGKTEGTFAATKTWKSAREETADSDILVAFDLGSVIKLAMEQGPGAMESVFKPLELDQIETLALGFRTDDKALEFRVSAVCDSLPWFFHMFKRAPGAEAPKFFPADLTGVSWAPLDLGAVVETILKKVPEIYPPAKSHLETWLASLKEMAGVDIEKEIIQQLGTGYFQVSHNFEPYTREDLESEQDAGNLFNIVAPDKEGAVVGVRLKDGKIVDTALRALAEKFAKGKVELDAREYMGWKLHSVKIFSGPAVEEEEEEIADRAASGPPALPFYFGVADDWLLVSVGRQELVERLLAAMKNPPAEHFWMRPDIQRGLDAMPGGETYARYQDLKDVGPFVAVTILEMAVLLPGLDFLDGIDEDFPTLLKGVEFPLHTFEKYHIGTRTVSSIARIVVSPSAE